MKLFSESQPLALELRDPEIRAHTIESQIKIGIPFQIRAIREKRGWTQEELAQKIGTTQNTISRLENPRVGKPNIQTLLRLAHAYDVGLLVRFVPFGFYGDVIDAMDSTHVEIPSYDEELAEQQEQEAILQKAGIAEANNAVVNESGNVFIGSTTFSQPISGRVMITSDHYQMRMFDNVVELPKMPPTPALVSSEGTRTEARTTYARTR